MKMIKLIGLAALVAMINGCAVHDLALASKNTHEFVRSCERWQKESRFPFNSVEDCVIGYLEKKDASLQRLGRQPESAEQIAKIKADKEAEKKRIYEYYYGRENSIEEMNRKAMEDADRRRQFGVCVIGTEAAYQDDLNSAYDNGDYEKVKMLRSKEYRYKLRKQCEQLLK